MKIGRTAANTERNGSSDERILVSYFRHTNRDLKSFERREYAEFQQLPGIGENEEEFDMWTEFRETETILIFVQIILYFIFTSPTLSH